jgi:hypothetical protein
VDDNAVGHIRSCRCGGDWHGRYVLSGSPLLQCGSYALRRGEEINQDLIASTAAAALDLDHAHRHAVLQVALLRCSAELLHELLQHAMHQPPVPRHAKHTIRFAAARLSIGQDARVVPVNGLLGNDTLAAHAKNVFLRPVGF